MSHELPELVERVAEHALDDQTFNMEQHDWEKGVPSTASTRSASTRRRRDTSSTGPSKPRRRKASSRTAVSASRRTAGNPTGRATRTTTSPTPTRSCRPRRPRAVRSDGRRLLPRRRPEAVRTTPEHREDRGRRHSHLARREGTVARLTVPHQPVHGALWGTRGRPRGHRRGGPPDRGPRRALLRLPTRGSIDRAGRRPRTPSHRTRSGLVVSPGSPRPSSPRCRTSRRTTTATTASSRCSRTSARSSSTTRTTAGSGTTPSTTGPPHSRHQVR